MNPLHPADDILIRFIGPEYITKPLQAEYEKRKKISEGYCNEGFVKHILNLLNLRHFIGTEAMHTEKECAICLEYRDEFHHAPVNTCENSNCSESFHSTCLKTFSEDRLNKLKFFNIVTIDCPIPYCGSSIKFDLNCENSLQ